MPREIWTDETRKCLSYIKEKRATDTTFSTEVGALANKLDPKPLIERFQDIAERELRWQDVDVAKINYAAVADHFIQQRLSKWADRVNSEAKPALALQ